MDGPQKRDDNRQFQVEHQKFVKAGLGIHQGVPHEHERHIIKIEFQHEKPVEHAGRVRVEDLKKPQPEEKNQGQEKTRTKRLSLSAAQRHKEGNMTDRNKDI